MQNVMRGEPDIVLKLNFIQLLPVFLQRIILEDSLLGERILGFLHLALVAVQKSQVVEYVECRRELRTPGFFISCQCLQIHVLSLLHLALISVQICQAIRHLECRNAYRVLDISVDARMYMYFASLILS